MTSNRHPTRRYDDVDRRREIALNTLDDLFTAAEAERAGLTRSDLRSDAVVPVLRGVYSKQRHAQVGHGLRCAAALLKAPPGSRIAHVDAARLFGLPAPESALVHVSTPRPSRLRSHAEIVTHSHTSASRTRALWVAEAERELAVTHPNELLLECARDLSLPESVALADAILTRSGEMPTLTPTADVGHAQDAPRLRLVRSLVRAGSGSPSESRTRALLALAGFPEPTLQHPVAVESGWRYLDLAFERWKVGIEYDGDYHYASEHQRQADIRREEELRALGWIIIHLVARDIYGDPAGVIRRVAEALKARGHVVHVEGAWRPHFPQRVREAA